jgi:Sec-independent protein secretion pathway component TatC
MLGMVVVFQIPTVVFFLAKMRMVTARFLWSQIKYAILLIFIAAAVLTPSTDPWNQIVFAAPMIGLYVLSIGIAWLVAPRRGSDATARGDSSHLKLVFAAAVVDRAWRNRTHKPRNAQRRPLSFQ